MMRRRSVRRRDTEPVLRTLVKGAVTLAVIGVVMWFGVTSYNGVPFRSYSTLYVDVPQIGNLNVHDPVRVGGVQVGQVSGEAVTPRGYGRVKLQLNPGTTVPADSAVAIRANGLLGARYVQLILGMSKRRARNGSTITGPGNALTFGVPETLETLDAPTRAGLQKLTDGLGTGLLGHGEQLNTAIRGLAGAAGRFTGLSEAILARPGALQRLLPSLDALLTPLDRSSPQYGELLAPAAQTLQAIADERMAVQSTLSLAPSALASATNGLTRGRQLLAAASALAGSAVQTLPLLPAGLKATANTLHNAPAPLAAATRLLRVAAPAVPAALKLTSALSPTLTPLQDGLANADPIVVQVGQHGCDIVNFGTTFRSMTGFGGVGDGPLGANTAGEFRAQLLPAPEVLASLGSLAPPRRAAYPAPCQYLDNAAAAAPTPLRRSGGGR